MDLSETVSTERDSQRTLVRMNGVANQMTSKRRVSSVIGGLVKEERTVSEFKDSGLGGWWSHLLEYELSL